jgi:hypothetical protein
MVLSPVFDMKEIITVRFFFFDLSRDGLECFLDGPFTDSLPGSPVKIRI